MWLEVEHLSLRWYRNIGYFHSQRPLFRGLVDGLKLLFDGLVDFIPAMKNVPILSGNLHYQWVGRLHSKYPLLNCVECLHVPCVEEFSQLQNFSYPIEFIA